MMIFENDLGKTDDVWFQVLNIVIQWIKKGGERNQAAALKILRRVHFAEIPQRDFESTLALIQDPYISR